MKFLTNSTVNLDTKFTVELSLAELIGISASIGCCTPSALRNAVKLRGCLDEEKINKMDSVVGTVDRNIIKLLRDNGFCVASYL